MDADDPTYQFHLDQLRAAISERPARQLDSTAVEWSTSFDTPDWETFASFLTEELGGELASRIGVILLETIAAAPHDAEDAVEVITNMGVVRIGWFIDDSEVVDLSLWGPPSLAALCQAWIIGIDEERPAAAEPLTLGKDIARAVRGEKPAIALDGRPVEQPWAVGPGRIIAIVCAVVGLGFAFLFPPMSIALGALSFILANTAWAHLKPVDPRRPLTVWGQVLAGVSVLGGVIGVIVWFSLR
ncbi:hypothetical protein [Microbacterium binotii]|uniref:hypothetical protein n=1 Tax=Microbacterium binotii TaxID=462710 RepID=UPI001F2D7269|nr:hypothetical protein [Microbacterium binotii]UIN30681.1 hypothetical protein LXM64_00295 [Microbacterium binotii]